MTISELRAAVAGAPDSALRIELPGGAALADHFHVTEVGMVTKEFVDCGGKRRSEVRCALQTLVANDTDHRLRSKKLAGILALADQLGLPAGAPVDVEHQERTIAIDTLDRVEQRGDTLVLRLAPKQTACLAEDACGIAPSNDGLTVLGTCAPDSNCC